MLGAYEVIDVLHMHGMIVSLNVDLGGPETAHADACGVACICRHQLPTDFLLCVTFSCLQETIADKEGATGSVSQPQKHTHMCMSSIDHSHVGDVTDVRWLSPVAFSREGAYRTEVKIAHNSLAAYDTGHLMCNTATWYTCRCMCTAVPSLGNLLYRGATLCF